MVFSCFGGTPKHATGAVDGAKLDWARRNGFEGTDLEAFTQVARLAQKHQIRSTDLREGEEFDQGQFGAIYAGTYKGGSVAVKRINQNGTSFRDLFLAILPEIQAVSHLVHPHIVRFHGVSSYFPGPGDDDATFHLGFVFERCQTGSLWDTIHKKRTKIPVPDKMRIAMETASAMAYMHTNNFVHRDLNCNNVLLTSTQTGQTSAGQTSTLHARVADFGGQETLLAGTPNYMAPEQLMKGAVGCKADCWAMGVVLWEILNEHSPWGSFQCNNPIAMRKLIVDERARLQKTPESKLLPGMREPVDSLLESAFQRDPAQRASMATIKANLSSIARLNRGGASPSPAKLAAPTTPHAPGTPTPPMPHRSSALAAAAASPPSSPAGGGGAAGGVRGQQNSQGDPEAQGKARMQVLLEAFYRKHNPAKIADAPYVVNVHWTKQDLLNQKLREAYGEDLSTFDEGSKGGGHTAPRKGGCQVQ